jgi:hypothetical protein
LHEKPAAQSASLAHVVAQLAAPPASPASLLARAQTYGEHDFPTMSEHDPIPSQPCVTLLPLSHSGGPHETCSVGYEHRVRSAPPQVPAHVPVPLQGARAPCGGSVAAVHVPSTPLMSHASHCPLHAPSQQKPSVQNPDVHCAGVLHALPFPWSEQAPLAQWAFGAQSVSALHVVVQAAVLHR